MNEVSIQLRELIGLLEEARFEEDWDTVKEVQNELENLIYDVNMI